MKRPRLLTGSLMILIGLWIVFTGLVQPSNDKEWSQDQARLPTILFDKDLVHIQDVRNFSYVSVEEYTASYYDQTYDLSTLIGAHYLVEPFSSHPGIAHTFVTFEFENGVFLSISIEIRKEVGEEFSALKGMFRQYELMYVVADEKDLINLRVNHRGDDVYSYPIVGEVDTIKAVLVHMLTSAQELHERPRFYHTITSSCTSTVVSHVNAVTPGRIPFDWSILLPGHSDEYAYELGLLDQSVPFEQLRQQHNITTRVKKFSTHPQFSSVIRQNTG